LDDIKSIVDKRGSGELAMLQTLREVAELRKEHDLALAAMERIVECEPDNRDTRFSLAYKYSERGNNDLALFHYLRIPAQQRDALAWNNLGVAYDRFSMPAKAVDAFRQAKSRGETLAMSNLANKLIGAGFLEEARQQCDEALKTDHHENVGHALARIRETPDAEGNTETELLTKAKRKSDFYRHFGRALSGAGTMTLSGTWNAPTCALQVVVEGSSFRATGAYEVTEGALANALIGSRRGQIQRTNLRYRGTVTSRAIEGEVTREGDSATAAQTLLDHFGRCLKFLMYLSDDEKELRVMENPESSDPRFYALSRQ
jgi:tetratricopeptide (TPR) repeat protein